MRGIIIDPIKSEIKEIEVNKIGGRALEGMYAALREVDSRFSGTVELVRLGPNLDLWIDEEANLVEGRAVWKLGDNHFSGPGLILCSNQDGETIALHPSIGIDTVENAVAWTNLETTGDFGEPQTENLPPEVIYVGGAPIYQERGIWAKEQEDR